ncbi:MAG: hypothetical protein ABR592_02555 [Nitriliruptorales bacterium]
MSDSPSPTESSDVVQNAQGTSSGEAPATIFPDEDRTDGATEQEERDRREGTTQRGEDLETLGPGSPGMTVDPDGLR